MLLKKVTLLHQCTKKTPCILFGRTGKEDIICKKYSIFTGVIYSGSKYALIRIEEIYATKEMKMAEKTKS